MRRIVAIAVVVGVALPVLAAGCSSDDSGDAVTDSAPTDSSASISADTSISARPADGKLDWGSCEDLRRLECATFEVPLDYDDPEGETIELALMRLPAANPSRRIGSLFVNPGGPGASGLEFLPQWALTVDAEIRDRFDLVSFDPRGVGASHPLECLSDDDKDEYAAFDAVPEPDEIEGIIDLSQGFAEACAAKYGDELAHFGTVDAARDLDRLREAVGDEKLTYLGFSYGTRLGSVYAELFPENIRAMVLDGAMEPDPDATDFDANQADGFQQAFAAYVADCDADPTCEAGPDAAGLIDRLFARVETDPIPAETDSRVLTEGWMTSGVLTAMYAKQLWPALSTALRQAEQGDASLMLEIADLLAGRKPDGSWNNLWEANAAVNCLDDSSRPSPEQVEAQARALSDVSPVFGPVVAWTRLQCAFWQVPANPIPVAVATGAPPIVVIGTTRDPATPFVWSERMASSLATGVLLARDGDGHTAYGESPCIDQEVNAYLLNVEVPADRTFCAE
jgi:pimeloyl-ACP methyl ester carboxylesterase